MDAKTNDPASNLSIPEGYTVEPLEDGRLAIYCASTGAWLGHFSPSLSVAQEVVKGLIDVHEEEEQSREAMPDLLIDSPLSGGTARDRDEPAPRSPISRFVQEPAIPAGDIVEARDGAVTMRSDDLRIRELEIVAGLAVEALRETGDEATAEVIRQVLENNS